MARTKNQPAPEVEQDAPDTSNSAAPAAETGNPEGAKAPSKSVVPSKYAGKYKPGGEGYNAPLATFIRSQCGEGDKFEFPAFFQLCRINGLPEDKVAHYEAQVAANLNGAKGRARMTLANMLRPMARKNQKLKNLSGEEVDVPEPAAKVTGAAAKAQASATTDTAPAGSEAGSEAAAE